MSAAEAEILAAAVRQVDPNGVSMEHDDRFFVVDVAAASGRWTLYSEEDWPVWRQAIGGG